MKEKEQVQSNGVSKAIIIAVGIILLLSACGNMTKMIFSPVLDEVTREIESEFEKEFTAEWERELEALEKELEAADKELQTLDQELDGMEIKLEVEQRAPNTFEVKIERNEPDPVAPLEPVELEYGR